MAHLGEEAGRSPSDDSWLGTPSRGWPRWCGGLSSAPGAPFIGRRLCTCSSLNQLTQNTRLPDHLDMDTGMPVDMAHKSTYLDLPRSVLL